VVNELLTQCCLWLMVELVLSLVEEWMWQCYL
jgi:hypothetical protein